MFPKLTDKSFVKQTPDNKANVFSFFLNGKRRYVGINESASSILGLCDGMHSIEYIISILSDKYKEDSNVVEKNVQEFLDPFIKDGIVIDNKVEISNKSSIKGSSEVNYPNAICWEITDYCPLNCRHCYLPRKNNNIISRADIESVLKMIDYAGVQQVQVTGGEALTHPELEYIIDSLINRGIITSISTSGFGFKNDMFQYLVRLKEVQGSMLRVSLDGDKNIHNYIRRNEYAYDNAIEFIKNALNNGIECQVETTLINQSKKDLEKLVALVKKLGVCSIEIGKLADQGNARKNKLESVWSPKEYVDILNELNSKYASKTFEIRLPKKDEEIKGKACGAGCNVIRIKPNFDVTPCPTLEFNLGNLHRDTMFDIMSKSSNTFEKIKVPEEKICSGCEKTDTCKYCIAMAYGTKDKVRDCSWFRSVEKYLKPFLD
ncbi:radical SAM protein [Clostridium botulinum]|uniref:Radical SAM protein n=1 Tax=Clostridium botulinum TaxID=1491 RepID=A0A6B4UDG4_CLOBO|nr:radical SAM protein [Clostridium botulinum]NFD86020.1 radical SAM protein [Clostridium botulinum]NFE10191.1 radical SAM protein [Clostridium botulinum]NFE36361.1 radical SAM protein [Clostridium botulinum]NFE50770.1 radical SAM protein [Clostridium botulinum]